MLGRFFYFWWKNFQEIVPFLIIATILFGVVGAIVGVPTAIALWAVEYFSLGKQAEVAVMIATIMSSVVVALLAALAAVETYNEMRTKSND